MAEDAATPVVRIGDALELRAGHARDAVVAGQPLVERSGREIPIQADAIGRSLDLADDEYVKLRGPDPLSLEITRKT